MKKMILAILALAATAQANSIPLNQDVRIYCGTPADSLEVNFMGPIRYVGGERDGQIATPAQVSFSECQTNFGGQHSCSASASVAGFNGTSIRESVDSSRNATTGTFDISVTDHGITIHLVFEFSIQTTFARPVKIKELTYSNAGVGSMSLSQWYNTECSISTPTE